MLEAIIHADVPRKGQFKFFWILSSLFCFSLWSFYMGVTRQSLVWGENLKLVRFLLVIGF